MEQKFKIGDVVMLKSGSPTMTITNNKIGIDMHIGRVFDGTYECSWFEGNKSFKEYFPQESLELKK